MKTLKRLALALIIPSLAFAQSTKYRLDDNDVAEQDFWDNHLTELKLTLDDEIEPAWANLAGIPSPTLTIIGSGSGSVAFDLLASGTLTLSVTPAGIGLGNVDNTSDVNKPISTAQQTALDGKQDEDLTLTILAGVDPVADGIPVFTSGSAGQILAIGPHIAVGSGTMSVTTGTGAGAIPTNADITPASVGAATIAQGAVADSALQAVVGIGAISVSATTGTASVSVATGTGADTVAAGNDGRFATINLAVQAALDLKRDRSFIFDADVKTWAAAVGPYAISPAQLGDIQTLVFYLRSQNLWSDSCLIPLMRGGYVASTGTTPVLGGWTSNSVVWSGTPTATSSGLATVATGSQYGTLDLTGLQSVTTLNVFERLKPTEASSADSATARYRWGFGNTGTARVVNRGNATGSLSGETVVFTFKDNSIDGRIGASTLSFTALEDYVDVAEVGASGTKLWKNKTSIPLSLTSNMTGTTATGPAATGYTINDTFFIAATNNNGATSFAGGVHGLYLLIRKPISIVQRETLTDLIAAIENPPGIVWWGHSFVTGNVTGYTDFGATTRMTPPTTIASGEFRTVNVNQGVSGETASQIATRATASFVFRDEIMMVWGTENDKDETDSGAVVDSIEDITDTSTTGRVLVFTPLLNSAWTGTQNANLTAIRAEIISRFPNNHYDTWTAPHVTAGFIDSGYLRYNSAGVQDTLHGNDSWYGDLVLDLQSNLEGRSWLP